jgi:hypothetical protein
MQRSTDTPNEPNGLAPSSDGVSPSPSSFVGNFGRFAVQIVSVAAVWDLARLDKVPGTHALIALGAIAAPALTAWLLTRRIQK